MNDIFEGERIYLRELEEDDVINEYLGWFKDNIVTKFLESKDLTRKDVIDYIKKGKETKTHYMYAICFKENNKHIGNIKIGPINHKHKISDLVIVIGNRNYWGKGLATEAIKIGNRIAFEKFNIRKLWGDIYSDNIGSIKCYIKAGWIIEARLKGQYLLNGKILDAVFVSCFNQEYFDRKFIASMKKRSLKLVNKIL